MQPRSILIKTDGRCGCTCGDVCPLGRMGMQLRCTADDLLLCGVPIHFSEKSGTPIKSRSGVTIYPTIVSGGLWIEGVDTSSE